MIANNFEFMPGLLSTQYKLVCFTVSIKLLFCNVFIGFLIVDQLILGLINTLDFCKIIYQLV